MSKIFLPITYVRRDTSRSSVIHSGDNDDNTHSRDVHMLFKADNPYNLVVGSAVQLNNTKQYGVIRWIGTLPDYKTPYAGIELVRNCIFCNGTSIC